MKKLFLFLFIFICAKIQAQTYNPSQGKVAINLPMGLNLGASLDSRSMFYDAGNFVYRAYTDTGEVNRYLNLAKYRTGFFPIWVNTGGTLSGGVITGGTNIPWIYKDGVGNGNLVRMLFDSTYIYQQLRGKLDTMYTVNDSTVRIQNGNTSYTLLIRGNGGNSLNNYTNNVIFDTATGRLTTKVTGRSDIVTQLWDRLRPSQAGLFRISGTYPFFTFTADSLGFEGTLKKQNTTSQNDSINIGAFRFKFQGTSALGIPWGNTASRPSNPQQFDLRGNLDSLKYEFWNGSNWISIGNGGAGGSGITSLSGDGVASGTGAVTFTLSTVNSNIFGSNTFLKFAVNAKGLIVSATAVTSSDITAALGFTPYNATNPAGYGTGNPNANLGSGYRIAIPGTNNLKTLLGSFIMLDSSTANSIRIIVDTAALTSNWLINHRDSIIIDTVNGLRRRPGTGTNPDTLYLAYNGGGGSGYNNYVRATSFSILPSNSSSTNRTNFLSMVTTANAQRKNIYIDTTGFQMDSLTISVSNITIFGKDSTTIVGTGTLAGHPIYKLFNVTGKNVVFQNFTIDGGNANLNDRDTTIGIYSQSGYGLNIYGMHFRNLYKAVEVHEVDNFVLDRNVFDSLSCSAGHINDGTNIRISRNLVRGWGLGNSNTDCFYLGSFTSLGGMHNFEAYGNIVYNNFGSALFVYETGGPTKNIDGFKVYNEYWDAKGYDAGGISVAADYADISGVNPVNFTTKLAVELSAGLYPYIHDINFQNSVLAINSRLEDTTKGLRVERCYFKPTNTSGAQYLIQFGGGNASTGGIGGQGIVNVATFKDNVIDASSGNIQYLVRLFNYAGDASIANDVDISGNTLIQNPGNSYSGGYGFHFNGTGSNRVNLNNNVIRGTYVNSAIVFQSGVVNRNLVVDGLKAPNGAFDASLTSTVAPNYKTFNIISDTTKPAQFFINGLTVTPVNGSPNSVLAAPKGSIAVDTATGTLYTKTSGTGNTGWATVSGASSLSGDVTGSLSGSNIPATLAASGVTAGSYTRTLATFDSKGRATSAASGTPWGSEALFGALYKKNNWFTSYDFTKHGNISVSVNSGSLDITGGSGTYQDYMTLPFATTLPYITMIDTFKIVAFGFGQGIGLKTLSSAYRFDAVGRFYTNASGSGSLILDMTTDSTNLGTAGSTLPIALNDDIELKYDLKDTVLTISAYNVTTSTGPITYTQTYSSTTSPYVPNTSQPIIMTFGGTQRIKGLNIYSNAPKNPNVVIGGNSKEKGYNQSSWSKRISYKLNATYPTVSIHAGGGDQSAAMVATIPEIIKQNPRIYIDAIGSNDIRQSVPIGTIVSNIQTVHDALTSAGIKVIHMLLPEDSTAGGVGQKALDNWLRAKYPSNYIDVWDTLSTSNKLKSAYNSGDGIHPNDAGAQAVYTAIVASGLVDAGLNRVDNYAKASQDIVIAHDSAFLSTTLKARLDSLEKNIGNGGTGGVSGTTNTVAKFTSGSSVGNSSITDDGTTVTVSENSVIGANTAGQVALRIKGATNLNTEYYGFSGKVYNLSVDDARSAGADYGIAGKTLGLGHVGSLASYNEDISIDNSGNTKFLNLASVNQSADTTNYKLGVLASDGTFKKMYWPSLGGTPGGSTTQLQYNSSGAFAGSYALTWNNGTSTLSATNAAHSGSVTMGTYGVAIANVNSSATFGLNITANQIVKVNLISNITSISITATSSSTAEYFIYFIQDGTGGRTVTGWPAGVKWAGGSAPTITSTANKTDIIRLIFDGSTYWANVVGQNY